MGIGAIVGDGCLDTRLRGGGLPVETRCPSLHDAVGRSRVCCINVGEQKDCGLTTRSSGRYRAA